MTKKLDASEWQAVNRETGETIEISMLQEQSGGKWRKIYADEFCRMLGIVGGGQTKVFAYMLEIIDAKNKIEGTQAEVAKGAGASLKTVNTLFSKLKENGFMKELRTGMHMLAPEATQYGGVGNKMAMLRIWRSGEDEDVGIGKPAQAVALSNPPAVNATAIKVRKQEALPKLDDTIADVFDYWKVVMGKNNASILTKARAKNIRARLDEGYTPEQIKQAIYGCSITPFNMGQNENNKRYNDIELICRDGAKLEGFADKNIPVESQKLSAGTERTINSLEHLVLE